MEMERDVKYQEKKTKIKKNQLRNIEGDKEEGNILFSLTKTLCRSWPPP
jgi:hypothetical protein